MCLSALELCARQCLHARGTFVSPNPGKSVYRDLYSAGHAIKQRRLAIELFRSGAKRLIEVLIGLLPLFSELSPDRSSGNKCGYDRARNSQCRLVPKEQEFQAAERRVADFCTAPGEASTDD